LAVEAARRAYRLPYRPARFHVRGDTIEAERTDGIGSFRGRYRGIGRPAPAAPHTLEHFLVERYCLYGAGGQLRAEIHHPPWPLQRAEATLEQHAVAPVELEGDPIYHYADRQDVLIWRPQRLR
jgi:uncharacterized protein YqjF (DUF2071 family)